MREKGWVRLWRKNKPNVSREKEERSCREEEDLSKGAAKSSHWIGLDWTLYNKGNKPGDVGVKVWFAQDLDFTLSKVFRKGGSEEELCKVGLQDSWSGRSGWDTLSKEEARSPGRSLLMESRWWESLQGIIGPRFWSQTDLGSDADSPLCNLGQDS